MSRTPVSVGPTHTDHLTRPASFPLPPASLSLLALSLFPKCYKLAELILPTSTNNKRLTDRP